MGLARLPIGGQDGVAQRYAEGGENVVGARWGVDCGERPGSDRCVRPFLLQGAREARHAGDGGLALRRGGLEQDYAGAGRAGGAGMCEGGPVASCRIGSGQAFGEDDCLRGARGRRDGSSVNAMGCQC